MDTGAGIAFGVLGVLFLIWGIAMIFALAVAVIVFIANWKLFEKAGEPGWSAIIPVYNFFQQVKITTGEYHLAIVWLILIGINMVGSSFQGIFNALAEAGDGDLAFLAVFGLPFALIGMAASLAGAVLGGYINYMFAKSYGQSDVMCVLAIFFTPIILLIMAFGKNTQYIGPQGHLRLWGKKE
ncbi:MAG: DUF5684 domain-containing protein [Ruminococcus sp.]|nr:DUF5684 domain-containing protein [Ruminococcus sp.]